jgi:hypothetical protein
MVLGVGAALAALWAGPILDAFGRRGLAGAALALAVLSAAAYFAIAARQAFTAAPPARVSGRLRERRAGR